MTQHFDEDAARRRLEADKDRVQGLIEDFRAKGLDEEAADQVGDLAHVTDPADQGSETFEREKDIAILEELEHDLAEIEAALQRLDEGTYGDRRGHRRADRARAPRGVSRRAHNIEHAHRRDRHAAAVRRGAGGRRSRSRRVRAEPGADGRRAARRGPAGVRPDVRRGAREPRVWVNGDEPADGRATVLADGDEVAVLPPVSGG